MFLSWLLSGHIHTCANSNLACKYVGDDIMTSNTISDLVTVNFRCMKTSSLDFKTSPFIVIKLWNEMRLSKFLDYVFHFAVFFNSVHINEENSTHSKPICVVDTLSVCKLSVWPHLNSLQAHGRLSLLMYNAATERWGEVCEVVQRLRFPMPVHSF